MALEKIEILGYRGFSVKTEVHFAIPNGQEGSGLSIITGANNSGKSSIIECFKVRGGYQPPSFTVSKFSLPRLIFLHGNVKVGGCETDKVLGVNGNRCSRCQQIFKPSKLLYPVSEKNYHQDKSIAGQWDELSLHLKEAFMITVFGYGAPKSDVSAIELLKSAWGDVHDREMEQTEIIDKRSEDDLRETWEEFIHTHHYDTFTSFYDSWLANHPRRTGEAYLNQFIKAQFIENNPIPTEKSFGELWEWFEKLQVVEIEKGKAHNKAN